MEVNLRALRSRAAEHPALPRMAEVAALLTGRPSASAEDAIVWLEALAQSLSVKGLGELGLDDAVAPDVVEAAKRASSMRANPIELTDDELHEILSRSL